MTVTSSLARPANTEYSRQEAVIYDAIYGSRGKDWLGEADMLTERIRTRRPGAGSVLDVACGTGAHLVRLADHFPTADGVELSPGMRDVAAAKVPGGTVHLADMRYFDLGRTYDAIVCMCYGIAFTTSTDELRTVFERMYAHLEPGGVVVVEPWWTPETFLPGFFTASAYQDEHRAISRVSHSVRDGKTSRMTIHYTVADATGVDHFTELDVLSLFHREEYTAAFEAAGFAVEFEEGGPTGRGLYLATKPGATP